MMMNNANLYRELFRIRKFEETILDNFPKGIFYGTTHTYLGQEANAVGVLAHLEAQDTVFSNHRCHGHFLAYGGDMRALFAELMGRETGVCGGKGGSQHLHWRNFYSNGIQGGIVPVAVGIGLAEKFQRTRAVSVVFLGDGTLGEGAVYEALNLASLWGAPVLFVIEDNRIAQTTPTEIAIAGNIAARFEAFGIPTTELDTSDVREIANASAETLLATRNTSTPHALILHTHRFGPHSKGDDTRDTAAVKHMRSTRDPLTILAPSIPNAERERIEKDVNIEVEQAFQQALADPLSQPTL
jgi:TPP-dependent pyruvate/acetoin dehydrogenase alpha subunit